MYHSNFLQELWKDKAIFSPLQLIVFFSVKKVFMSVAIKPHPVFILLHVKTAWFSLSGKCIGDGFWGSPTHWLVIQEGSSSAGH